jgi:thiol-disulfide isomerase/thioredoxin
MVIASMWKSFALAFSVAAILGASGCSTERTPTPEAKPAASAASKGRVEWVTATEGEDVATIVRRELERARKDGRDLLVYVGAKWCEPCERFHHAAEQGQLDDVFPRLRIVEFDLDRDAERLAVAGYSSKLIPLFVAPNDDGTSSDRRIEGSVKGEAAVMEIATRLRRILPRASAGPTG